MNELLENVVGTDNARKMSDIMDKYCDFKKKATGTIQSVMKGVHFVQ